MRTQMWGMVVLTVALGTVSLVAQGNAADIGDRVNERLDHRGDRINERLDRRGDAINERLDRRGDAVNERLDQKADRAQAAGKEELAARLDRKGDGSRIGWTVGEIALKIDLTGKAIGSRIGGTAVATGLIVTGVEVLAAVWEEGGKHRGGAVGVCTRLPRNRPQRTVSVQDGVGSGSNSSIGPVSGRGRTSCVPHGASCDWRC